jgi:hypothetical protein
MSSLKKLSSRVQSDVQDIKTSKPSEVVKTELRLTPFRACWLWNAAGIDLSLLLTQQSQIQAFF